MNPLRRRILGALTALLAVAAPLLAQGAGGAVPWPAQGRIVYRVYHGDSGLRLGQTTHTWSHDAKHYRMSSVVETTGLAALFKNFRLVQKSVGTVTPEGLRPERFSADQQGKPPQSARFDWAAGRVFIDRGDSKREADIHAGDQDVLSIWHQLARQPLEGIDRTLTVVNNKAASVSRIRDQGVETVKLPLGELRARHLSVRSQDGGVSLDLWLATGQHLLPVRIRITDRKGEVLDQQAERIELGAEKPVP
ncbi:DUF3108 domain-containing protein [Nitrogeniibacter mangrovi]|uniref:DUF3108 domain-containing protein n=1 Tax=Nitrogeniibacter mangrovi TaxID=2016596 RepID=A0A6C1B3Q1_9RHOO|nr:DUF3108 domain-containing protein [Nitrogeniibacter mangrovi]QID18291.1 DUF3108 domain-containing protein [Nitrogeniibacter mangrovi]